MSEFSIAYSHYSTLNFKRVFGPEFLNLPGIIPHLQLILFSATFYHFVYAVFGPLLLHVKPYNPKVPPTELSRFYWNINTVSIAQSIVNSGLAVYILAHTEFRDGLTAQERILGYHSETAAALAISTGYFCFHLVQVWVHKKIEGNFMFTHSVCALCAVCLGFRPLSLHYNAHLMIWELPNIFLNIQRQLDSAGFRGSLARKLNRIILLATYTMVRLGTGTLTLLWMASDMLTTLQDPRPMVGVVHVVPQNPTSAVANNREVQLPVALAAIQLGSLALLHYQGFYWFAKILTKGDLVKKT